MLGDFLRVGDDGMVRRYRHYYNGRYEDMGRYKTEGGNFVALNEVTGSLDEVKVNRWNNSWERVKDFSPRGKVVSARKDSGIVDEVELNFWRMFVKKADFVPS